MSKYKKYQRIYKESKIQSKLVQQINNAVEKYHPILQKYMKVKITIVICDEHKCDIGLIKGKGQVIVIGVPFVETIMKNLKLSVDKAVRRLITHEALHAMGLKHDSYGYARGYYSHLDRDVYSPKVEKMIFE